MSITIKSSISSKDFDTIKGAISDHFGEDMAEAMSSDNISIKNNLFTYSSRMQDGEMHEEVTINVDGLVKVINVIGNLYSVIKPMAEMAKKIFAGFGENLENILGKTQKTVNGVVISQPVTVGRRVSGDAYPAAANKKRPQITIDIKATADTAEEAKEVVDNEFAKLGYHK